MLEGNTVININEKELRTLIEKGHKEVSLSLLDTILDILREDCDKLLKFGEGDISVGIGRAIFLIKEFKDRMKG